MPHHHTRRDFLWTLGCSTLAGLLGNVHARAATATHQPNIVLFFADDLGWTDLGCFGSNYYETPNLDKLCSQSVKFTSAYSNGGNCAPSRACLLSGQYVPRHGVYGVGSKLRFDKHPRGKKRKPGKGLLKWNERKILAPENASALPAGTVTFGKVLQAAGYKTGFFGKWGLSQKGSNAPGQQGFDVCVPMPSYISHWITPDGKKKQTDLSKPHKYLSDHLADKAVQFIEENRDRPFLLFYPDYLVHVPLQAKQEMIDKYKQKKPVGGHRNPAYAAMLEHLDNSCGRIIDKLAELGLADNTMLIFFSDNGGCGSNKKRGLDHAGGITSNHPLRGMKGMLYEGGIRVPMFVRWPGVTKPGTTCDVPVIGTDLFPTFLKVAQADKPDQPLDGESLVPLLKGVQRLTREDIYWWMPGYLPARQAPANAMRSGDWKLIEYFEDGKIELFNLRDDISEINDLAAKMPDKVAELHARMKAWRQSIGAKIPEKNPDYDPKNNGRW